MGLRKFSLNDLLSNRYRAQLLIRVGLDAHSGTYDSFSELGEKSEVTGVSAFEPVPGSAVCSQGTSHKGPPTWFELRSVPVALY